MMILQCMYHTKITTVTLYNVYSVATVCVVWMINEVWVSTGCMLINSHRTVTPAHDNSDTWPSTHQLAQQVLQVRIYTRYTYVLTTFIMWRSFWQEFCARLIWWLDYNEYVVGWDSTEVFFDYQGIRLERYRFCCIIKLAWVLCYSKNFTITKYYKYSFHGYHMIQNIGGRKFWQNSSYQKLADNILVDAQNFQNA